MSEPSDSSKDAVAGCPTADEILGVLRDADEFTIAIRGFSCVEKALDVLLEDALPAVEAVDVERLTVNLKLNLAVALKLIPVEDTASVLILSRIRNTFAHDFKATLSRAQVQNLVNSLSERQRKLYAPIRETEGYDQRTLWKITLVLWKLITLSVKEHREAQDTREVYEELLAEEVARANNGREISSSADTQEEVRRRVAEKARLRNARYKQTSEDV